LAVGGRLVGLACPFVIDSPRCEAGLSFVICLSAEALAKVGDLSLLTGIPLDNPFGVALVVGFLIKSK
jgi:hypothetical protein